MVCRLKRLGLQPKTVIDVGANVGQFAIAAGKIFDSATIHAFEPLPDCYAKLQKAASGMTNVRTSNLALGDARGDIDFHVNSFRHSSSVLSLGEAHKRAFPSAREIRKISVKATTLDDACAGTAPEGPILLKLDVQGYEDAVLRGARRLLSKVDHLLLELSFQSLYENEPSFEDMIASLREQGLHMTCAVDFLRDPHTGAFLQVDGLFSRRIGADALAVKSHAPAQP